MHSFGQFIIRTSAFLRKEIVEVLRQPRLILALVFGPFLILLLFGLGYRNEARAVRTLFVAPQDSEMARQLAEYAPTISPQLIYMGILEDEAAARSQLASGGVDMVVVAPPNAYDTIRNNQQASFQMYHNEIDPAQVSYLEFLGQLFVDEVNRRVLSNMAAEGQQDAASVQNDVRAARENAAAMRAALQAGNPAEARSQQRLMRTRISSVATAVGASVGLLSSVQQSTGSQSGTSEAQDLLNLLTVVQDNPSSSTDVEDKEDYSTEISQIEQEERDLADLETRLAEFQSISPQIMVRPFSVQSFALSPFQFTPMHFFTPGVIVLLLQHIVVTVAGLSIVRERRAGTMELFRVSPIKAGEALIGKYLSYMLFGIFVAALLALLLAFGLRVPMLGSWVNFAIVGLLVLFASLGIGFFISLIATTESQAVQFAMIVLLLSVFFSGFILDLRYLWGPVRIVSWLLPSTYGTILLQNIMLRGASIDLQLISGLAAIGVVMYFFSWWAMRRQMAHE